MKIRNGTEGDDRLVGSDSADRIVGKGGADVLIGLAGADRLDGGSGDDRIAGGGGADTLLGGAGDDRLDGGTGADVMRGDAGSDTYVVDDAGDRIIEQAPLLLAEVNTVEAWIDYRLGANLQNLALQGEAREGHGNDLGNRIWGTAARNILSGAGGADELYGFEGQDRLDGGEGDDWLDGGTGADTMIGGAGNDGYMVDNAGDRIIDTGGEDTVVLTAPLAQFTMADGIERLVVQAVPSAPDQRISITGNMADNRIDGGAGNDIIDGNGGDDLLWGGDGYDVIYAGGGDDIVLGSEGADSIYLGGNSDVVIYQVASEIAGDAIEHFSTMARIDLSVIDASTEAGDQAFTFLGAEAFTGQQGEIRCETNAGGFFSRLFIDLDGDTLADMSFTVAGSPPTEATFTL